MTAEIIAVVAVLALAAALAVGWSILRNLAPAADDPDPTPVTSERLHATSRLWRFGNHMIHADCVAERSAGGPGCRHCAPILNPPNVPKTRADWVRPSWVDEPAAEYPPVPRSSPGYVPADGTSTVQRCVLCGAVMRFGLVHRCGPFEDYRPERVA